MTYPNDMLVEDDDEERLLDPSLVTAARAAEANEADLIEQAIAVPEGDDERSFDR
jgi:hypothetical protein